MADRFHFAHLPTPIDNLTRIREKIGGPRLLVKRDDLTGLAFGGNKTRKLERLIAEALANGARMVITTGAAQSNHCRQTAAAAAAAGLSCRLVLVGADSESRSGNLYLDHMLGADIVWTSHDDRDAVLEEEYQRANGEGKQPYLIPYGGSNALGATAYYDAFKEVHQQLGGQMPDWIVFASSSGGTQAGLVAGSTLLNVSTKILGVSVDEPAGILRPRVADLAGQVSDLLGKNSTFSPEQIHVNDDYLGEGYGVMGSLEKNSIVFFAREEGLLLDPVYTGRAAGGLVDLIKRGFFKQKESVLFWHTGGTPGLFADQYRNDILPGR